jgi:quinol monooxygenase YgiN
MIFIVVKWPIKPEHADNWLTLCGDFTAATRAEEGNLFFDWSRSADDPQEWVLVEGFRDGDAGAAHVGSPHFTTATQELGRYLAATPRIISQEIPATDWSELAEIQPR